MAYAERYRFAFDSQAGRQCTIKVYEDGYTGAVLHRALGGSPRIMLEQNGCIRGSSLSFEAECIVEDEFADLYTSDPLRYKVYVYAPNLVWEGYITPELYAAPWIDPPYNVTLTATDGLGELKRYAFEKRGRQTLSSHIAYLLGKTGFINAFTAISMLKADGSTPAMFFAQKLNLDSHAGESCYDVLQGLLGSLHATVLRTPCTTAFTNPAMWLIMRESDVASKVSGTSVKDSSGNAFPIVAFGSMSSNAVWPVGQMSMEIEPARRSLSVVCPNVYASALIEPVPSLWSGTGTASGTDVILGSSESIDADATLPSTAKGTDMKLVVRARYTGDDKGSLAVIATLTGKVGTSSRTYYLRQSATRSGEKYATWSTTFGTYPVEIDESRDNSSSDLKDYEIVLPFTKSGRSSLPLNTVTGLKITLGSSSTGGSIVISEVTLDAVPVYGSLTTDVTISNGARGDGDQVDSFIADSTPTNRYQGYIVNAFDGSPTFVSGVLTEVSAFGAFMAKDNALSVALPRIRIKGTLNVADAVLPIFFSTGGVKYIAESLTWDMYNDELEVSMLSLPAAELDVASLSVYTDTGQEGASASVFPSEFSLAADDTSAHSISIVTPGSWTITSVPSWLSFSQVSGTGNASVTFTATANSSRQRTVSVLVAGLGVKIVQAGVAESISLNLQSFTFGSSAEAAVGVTVTANAAWTVTGVPSWLSASPVSGSAGTSGCMLKTLATNSSNEERSAVLTFQTSGGATATFTATQAAASSSDSYGYFGVNSVTLGYGSGRSEVVPLVEQGIEEHSFTCSAAWLAFAPNADGSSLIIRTTGTNNTGTARTAAIEGTWIATDGNTYTDTLYVTQSSS